MTPIQPKPQNECYVAHGFLSKPHVLNMFNIALAKKCARKNTRFCLCFATSPNPTCCWRSTPHLLNMFNIAFAKKILHKEKHMVLLMFCNVPKPYILLAHCLSPKYMSVTRMGSRDLRAMTVHPDRFWTNQVCSKGIAIGHVLWP